MKLKLTAFLTVWLLIAQTLVHAQSGHTLSGKITGTDGQPLDGATIYLKRAADSTLIKTALANPDGGFMFNQLPAGGYRLTVTMIGYSNYTSAMMQLKRDTAINITLQKGTALKEVSVVSKKPMVEHLIDRTVVNVDALLTAAGGNALDVLEKSPGVLVDENSGISLQGKQGVTIYIDDKPTYLSGASLENYLRSLPSSAVDRVELMPNPPAKYDAAGNGGIINIRLKKTRETGFNGNLSLAYTQGRYPKSNNSFNFNYRHNRLNVTGMLGYSYFKNFSDLTINRYFNSNVTGISPNFLQNGYNVRLSKNYSTRVGIDYYASDKTTWGMVVSGLINPFERTNRVTSNLLNKQFAPDSIIIADNKDGNTFRNGTVNLNYRHEYDKKGHDLTVDADYLTYRRTNRQSFDNQSYLPDNTLYYRNLLTGTLPSVIDIYSAKTDYTRPLQNGIKLAGGLKTSFTNTDNIADYFSTTGNVTVPDYGKTNHFLYKEYINAGYLNASREFKRVSLQAGLRFENTISDGHQLGNAQKPDSTFRRNYNGFFPTFFVLYKFDTTGNQTLKLNYGRRIDRPYYEDLNPFLSPLDKFTYYVGNPFLRPSYMNEIELAYTYKNITLTAAYSKINDDVNETIEILNGIYYSRPGNLGKVDTWFGSVDADFNPAKWLNLHLYASLRYQHTVSNFYTGILNTKGTVFFTRPTVNVKPGKDWTIQVTDGYQTRFRSNQFTLGYRQRLDLAVSKKLSPSASIKVAANDIFKQFVNTGVINNLANTYADWVNKGDFQTVAVAFTYRFGKAISGQRKHDANGAESESSRVKN